MTDLSRPAYDDSALALTRPADARAPQPDIGQAARFPELALAAECSRLAYLGGEPGDDERLRKRLLLLSFNCLGQFDFEDGSQGFAAEDGQRLLVVIRGTQTQGQQGLRDIITDLKCWPHAWELAPTGVKVHAGFLGAAKRFLQDAKVLALLAANRPGKRLVLCGHSLGGAVANLLALAWGADQLVTIGQPRTGNAAFANWSAQRLPGERYVRIVDHQDIVTEVPPALLAYQHAGQRRYIRQDGELMPASFSDDEVASDRATAPSVDVADIVRSLDALLPGAGAARVPIRALTDHSPINYLRALW